MNPRYPCYIPSYKRWETPFTARTLEYMNVPYYIVVQPDQYLQYAKVINSKKILVLPKPWWKPGEGLIHARNWIWEHAKASGAKRFWQFDDNIKYFFRLNQHMKIPVNSGTIIRAAEDFVDRYSNVGQAGFQYEYFAPRKQRMNPFILNTRIYSCTLNLTSIKHRYDLVYNDDTDMSIKIMRDGYCTVLFNAFLCGKVPTMMMKGGNAEIYKQNINGRYKMAQALAKRYPNIVEVIERWNRHQHRVDYSEFKTLELKLCKGIRVPKGVNEYGMELIKFNEPQSIFNL